MNLCVSQACTLSASFADDIIGYSDGGCSHLEVWLTKLEKHLETSSVAATRQLLADRGVSLVAAAYQGGLLLSQGDQRAAAFDHYKRRLELCQQFGVRMLLVVADFATKIDEASLGRAVVSLTQAAQWAAAFDVRLGLEFRGTDAFCSCLETALLLVDQCGEPNVGVCLDTFHYYKGPSKPEDLERLTRENLAHVQLCDVPGVPREVMTDGDRVFPGEGDFRLTPIVGTLRRIGYDGWVSLEVMNPMVWQAKPSQVADLGMTALRRTVE
jgi:sugar phosphate isomerase/epimerase